MNLPLRGRAARGAVALTAALGLTALAGAAEQDIVLASNRQVYVGAGLANLHYVEVEQAINLDYETGHQPVGTLGAKWQGTVAGVRAVYLEGSFAFARGATSYNGGLFNASTGAYLGPWQSRTNVETADAMLRVGKGFVFGPDSPLLTPYLALGRHRWVRNGAASDPYGYLEIYKHNMVQTGVLAQGALGPSLVATIDLNVGWLFGAGINVPAYGLDTALHGERALGAGLRFDYAITRSLHAALSFDDLDFKYGKSGVMNQLLEPDSSTIRAVSMLSLGWAF